MGEAGDGPADALAGWAFAERRPFVALVHAALAEAPIAAREGEAADDVGLVRLAALGQRLADARAAWDRARYPADPMDATIAGCWTRWAAGNPFHDQRKWLALLEKPVVAAFRQALSARPLPPDVVARAIGDLRDALFYQLIGGRGGVSGFAELAAHALETAPGGPIAPLVEVLSPTGRATVASCVSRRGHWPSTLERALPSLAGPGERALHVQRAELDDALAWSELHTALRLVASWAEGGGDDARDWAIVTQNLGRSRGRLRAVVAAEPPAALVEALVRVDGLAERTRAAARRWGWSWAWEALSRGFSFDLDQPVIRPCRAEPGVEPLDADDQAVLDGWFVLAVLRGRGATVRRWCTEGKGDADGTWGRLLLELPEGLRDPDGGFVRVRAGLADGWDARLATTAPLLREIGRLPPSRKLKDAFWAVAGPAWPEAIARPRGGFPTFVEHARAWTHGTETAAAVPPVGEEEP